MKVLNRSKIACKKCKGKGAYYYVYFGEIRSAPCPACKRAHKCENCAEPEDGGQFGWFDDADGTLVCLNCGHNPTERNPSPPDYDPRNPTKTFG
jgi:uncharacterized lipoprotein NlpE involved in copper resistance